MGRYPNIAKPLASTDTRYTVLAIQKAVEELKRTRLYVSTSTVAQLVYGDLNGLSVARRRVCLGIVYGVLASNGLRYRMHRGRVYWLP